jgi:hypothetical protein
MGKATYSQREKTKREGIEVAVNAVLVMMYSRRSQFQNWHKRRVFFIIGVI